MNDLSVPEIDGKIAVSVEFAFRNPQFTYFTYDKEAAEYDLDPWRIVDCDLDKLTKEVGYVLFGNKVRRGFIIYMQPPS